ncbi:XdhC family protein [Microbacterium pumilum]|uniref:XdhC family protein n=1 Tax=Microbacterium pumilum TaxID=344165 RepID=A0ABN2RZT2_9MICO
MLELAHELLPLLRAGADVAVVTVTRVARSAPRGVGASMAVTRECRVIGSISGGCVESEAVSLALAVLATGQPRAASFGYSDEAAHAAGLACGGSVDVIAHRLNAADGDALEALDGAASDRAVTVSLDLASGAVTLVDDVDPLSPRARSPLGRAVAYRESRVLPSPDDLLVLSQAPRPRLIILGAGEHAAALCRVAAAAGFAVSVCDTWELMATPERFPDAVEVVVAPPHEYLADLDPATLDARTAVCVLTHDERVDIPALKVALGLPVGFVGAMGARSTVAHRMTLLRAAGVDEVTLARLHSPLGLDLGGSSPLESAVAVVAEIVASRYGGPGAPLRETEGPLHRSNSADDAGTPASCTPKTTAPSA